jgi:hypothetical protein
VSGYRAEIEASAGPSRLGRVGGGALLLVRVRLFDGPDAVERGTGLPDAFTDLDPRQARTLAIRLIAAADDAERQTLQANHWQEPRR